MPLISPNDGRKKSAPKNGKLGGRPPTRGVTVPHSFRLKDASDKQLRALSKELELTLVETVEYALAELAKNPNA